MNTISFHLNSTDSIKIDESRYRLNLTPALRIPHEADKTCTVYLHNLMFNNNLANVDEALYKNDKVALNFDSGGILPVSITFPAGAYSLQDVERKIAQVIYDNYKTAVWDPMDTAVKVLANTPAGLANPYTGTWEQSLTASEVANLSRIPPDVTGRFPSNKFYLKPVTIAPDLIANRVVCVAALPSLTVAKDSTLFTSLLGYSAAQINAWPGGLVTAASAARVDKTRSVAFHVPSLATGTYGTGGALGGSQLALVPITAKLGETQNWEVSVPIEVPCRAAGSTIGHIDFYLANEDGLPINLLQDRFEGVVVVKWKI